MKDCFKRLFLPFTAVLFFAGAFLGSCTDVDDKLGWGLLPDDQNLLFSETTLGGIRSYMAMPDSIPVNQRNMWMLGNYTTDGYGHIRSGAAVQFVPSGFSDEEEFYGSYMPMVDSVYLRLSIAQVYGDTTKEQKFYIYRLKEQIPATDTVFFPGFNAEPYADMTKPIFSFTLSSDYGTLGKKLEYEAGAEDFISELIGVSGDVYKDEYADSLFHNIFKGWYIAPSSDPSEAPLDAGLYMISPLSTRDATYGYLTDDTYIMVYGRNFYKEPTDKEKTDPVVIDGNTYYLKDTTYVYYSFDDTYIGYPNTNVMTLERDYGSATLFNESQFVDPHKFTSGTIPSEDVFYVQGLLGVSGYLDFGDEFLRQLHALATVNGEQRILNVNRAVMHIWLEDDGVPYMNLAPSRLGMYYKYKGILPQNIPDYDYYYTEWYLGNQLAYGGYINRSMGYYEMNITTYVRDLANKTDKTPKQVWLGMDATATNIFAPVQVALANPPDDAAGEPAHKRISVEITYTLHKKAVDE